VHLKAAQQHILLRILLPLSLGESPLSSGEFSSLVGRQSHFVARVGSGIPTIDLILTALVASAPQKRQIVQTRALGSALEIALALATGDLEPPLSTYYQLVHW